MNIKMFSLLMSLSVLFSTTIAATKALTQIKDITQNNSGQTTPQGSDRNVDQLSPSEEPQQPSIQFGKATTTQNTCTIENQLLGEDGRTLALAFNQFSAENGKRKNCNVRINTTIPKGFHVQSLQILYQGSTEVALGKNTSLSRSYTFNGRGIGIIKAQPKTSNFKESNPLFQEQDNFTAVSASCGGTGQLGMNMVAQSSKESSIIVDTADLNTGDVQLHIDLAPCK
jgi:hypothetical protein